LQSIEERHKKDKAEVDEIMRVDATKARAVGTTMQALKKGPAVPGYGNWTYNSLRDGGAVWEEDKRLFGEAVAKEQKKRKV
jgi:hypothetical protein